MIKLGLGGNHTMGLGLSLNRKFQTGVGGGVTIVNDGVLAPFVTFTRASTATYFDSAGVMQTAAANTPRIDYDPETLQLRGLLVEEQRTNLLRRSQEFDNASWGKINSTATANAAVAPDGTLTAEKLVENASAGVHALTQSATTVAATVYTYSVFLKAAERGFAQVRYENSGSTQFYAAMVNLSNGSFTTASFGSPTSTSASVTSAGNGWWRVSITVASNNTSFACIVYAATGGAAGNNNYTGDGTSGILVWGAQLEAGTFATSYIPTTSAAVTRAVDAPAVTTLASIGYNAAEGSVFVELRPMATVPAATSIRVLELNDGTANNRAPLIYGTNASTHAQCRTAGVDQALLAMPAWAANATLKAAAAFKANDFAFTTNGTAPQTDSSGTLATATRMDIGWATSSGSERFNGHIRRLRYYNRRLSNAELQSLTA